MNTGVLVVSTAWLSRRLCDIAYSIGGFGALLRDGGYESCFCLEGLGTSITYYPRRVGLRRGHGVS